MRGERMKERRAKRDAERQLCGVRTNREGSSAGLRGRTAEHVKNKGTGKRKSAKVLNTNMFVYKYIRNAY
jgi:hypothetical protein